MYSSSKGVHLSVVHGTALVKPDVAVIPVRLEVTAQEPSAVPTALQHAMMALEMAVTPAAVQPVGYRSSSEKATGNMLFNGGSRTTGTALCRVEIGLSNDDDYIARITAVEAIRGQIAGLEIPDTSVGLGEPHFAVSDPNTHRSVATTALRDQVENAAISCLMKLRHLEVDTTLEVHVSGPCEAHITLSAKALLIPDE